MIADGKTYRLQLWDTAGQERFRTLTSAVFRGAHGIVLVYNCRNRESFNRLRQFADDIQRSVNRPVGQLLLGTNPLPAGEKVVDSAAAQEFADANGMLFAELSDQNPDEGLERLVLDIRTRNNFL